MQSHQVNEVGCLVKKNHAKCFLEMEITAFFF